MIVFVQPFSLQSPGGGARILRALLTDAPSPFVSVCTGMEAPPICTLGTEKHLPLRPHFGRIESTRFGQRLYPVERLLAPRFMRRLEGFCRKSGAQGIHAIAHGMDYWYSFQIAQRLQLPYFLSVHDDLGYALHDRPEYHEGMAPLSEVWNAATARFVISEAMGQEYCRRYGRQPFVMVTDGLETVPPRPRLQKPSSCRVYFMGLFHRSYIDNFRALLEALALLQKQRPDYKVSITCRCGAVPPKALTDAFPVIQLPFGSEQEVAQDMEEADMLYLPLPFCAEYEAFVRFSLSTKMISYLGSGLPILYHGPSKTAAGGLLAQHHAALLANAPDPACLLNALQSTSQAREAVVCRALDLARGQFLLAIQRQRFWDAFESDELKGRL